MTDVLTLSEVSKSFGALKVTDDVSLAVPKGQALGIIGPNGAGKSTLFNLITGNFLADAGTVTLLGRDVTRVPAMEGVRMGVGRSFQIPQPFEGLTVFENLLTAAAIGRDKPEAQVVEDCAGIMADTGLLPKANVLAGGLTEAECKSLVATIKGLHPKGGSIVWIEHVLDALTSVVERLLVLDFGKVIGVGAPDAIMASKAVREIYLGIEA